MAHQRKPSFSWGGTRLDRRQVLLGLAAVGAFAVVDLGAVLYAGGWVGGDGGRLTQRSFIDVFKAINGPQIGFRKNHGKGVSVAGFFESNGNGSEITYTAELEMHGGAKLLTPVMKLVFEKLGNDTEDDMARVLNRLG